MRIIYYLSANKTFTMKPYFLSIAAFCLLAVYARWHYVCKMRLLCDEPVIKTEQVANLKNLSLNDGSKAVLSGYEQFAFDKNGVKPTLSNDNSDFIEKAVAYLKANPDKNLKITGYYRPSEKDAKDGFYENLGLARAASIRSLMMAKGIPEDRFTLDHQMGEENLPTSAAFNAFTKTATVAANTATNNGAQFSFTNMTFSDANFDSGSDVFKPGAQFVLYADSVVTYMKANPNKNLTIIGHTDNVGEDKPNMSLGQRRAVAVKNYFLKKGIKSKIATNSKGESEPIAPNETEDGKAKNRRVNVMIN